jgi:hypothetical protein
MSVPGSATEHSFVRACTFSALTGLTCAGLITAGVVASAPPAVLPLLIALCIGLPMAAAFGLRDAAEAAGVHTETLPTPLAAERAIEQLRRSLDQLPETRHPLDL